MVSLCCRTPVALVVRRAPPALPIGHAPLRPAGPAAAQPRPCRPRLAVAASQQQQPQGRESATYASSGKPGQLPLPPGVLRGIALCGAAVALAALAPCAAQAAATAAAGSSGSMLKSALDFVLHLDVHLGDLAVKYGSRVYAILFAIVFAETGLVVTPFLPGDSLLFATGALAALGKLSLPLLLGCYVVAATLGDAVNYALGSYMGTAAFKSRLLKREHVTKTEQFYKKYGGKTVVLARFVPIVRTFAPFVAGVGSMPYGQFALYNVAGAVLWTVVCVGAGYAFGNVPAVHENFSLVVLGIVLVSLLPIAWEMWSARRQAAGAAAAAPPPLPASVPHSTPAAAAAAVDAALLPPQPAEVAAAAAIAAEHAKRKLQAAAAGEAVAEAQQAADPLEQARVAECDKDPGAPDCRIYED